jgi:hypothetical protein
MIGTPTPNIVFNSSKRIPPSVHVQTTLYNEMGYIPHPLQQFGSVGGVMPKGATAGSTGNVPGGFAWQMGHPHTINGREPGSQF